jgi:choline dehydrogenase-like flavoprotein
MGANEMTNCVYGIEAFERRRENYKIINSDVLCNVDICIIGSGAAGAILGTKLAESGKSVVILEKGGYFDGESMNQREADMIPLLWKNAGANFTSNLRVAIAQGSCLGGSTVINDAVCFRIPLIVIEQWKKMGVSITNDEWDKANDEVSKRINIQEVTDEELNTNARKLKEACEKFRYQGDPLLQHYKNHRNCGQSISDESLKSCVQCGFCHLGCHYDTKQSMLVTYIHDALVNENLNYNVYCNCRADRITYENGIANGVNATFVNSSGLETYRIRVNAKVIIVSAGAIASSNLLQKSLVGGEKVGKGLALHPAPFVMGLFDEEIYGNRGIPMSYTCHEFGVTNGVEKGGFLIESIFLPIFQMALAIPSMGLDHKRLMQNYNRYTMAGIMSRDDPVGKVMVSYNGNPKVIYNLSEQTIEDMAKGMSILSRMWFNIGAKAVITSHRDVYEIGTKADIPKLKDAIRNNPDGLMLGSAHPQGGNRMGNDENECVVDSNCKIFGFDNLYVCDASVFPTALGVNPQLTVMSLATITANKIIKNWKDNNNFSKDLGNICHITQPRYCKTEQLSDQFSVVDHNENLLPSLVNSDDEKIIVGENWKFNPQKLQIYNNIYWKGFYGRNVDAITTALRYFGGFYKRFGYRNNRIEGITHPFETQVINAKSIVSEKEIPGYGKVVHLEYQDFPFSNAYDLLKIVDENTIIGKAFLGQFGKGIELFSFSMSKIYDIDFLTKQDLLTLFNSNELSHKPNEKELVGRWEGMLISDSSLSPRSQIFYFDYEDGEIDMRYSFANMLHGRSDITITENSIFRLDDQTPFHDEIRMVTPEFAVGLWISEWSSSNILEPLIQDLLRYYPIKISNNDVLKDKLSFLEKFYLPGIRLPKELGLSFLQVEENEQNETRIGLSYVLKKI